MNSLSTKRPRYIPFNIQVLATDMPWQQCDEFMFVNRISPPFWSLDLRWWFIY